METSDQWGRTTSRKGFPDGPGGTTVVEEKYEYDLAGNLTRLTDANNNDTLFDYDALNRLVKVTNPLGEATDYDYDRMGDLTQIIQYQGATAFPTVKQYSERGALVSKQPPSGQPTTYKYNANGLPVEVTDASGKITTTQYYQDNKVAQVRANQDRIDYCYSHLGGVEKYQPVNDTTGNGEYLRYSYYSTGLTKQRGTAIYVVKFQYDILGNRTKVTDPFNFATDYQYNSLNRLTTVTAGEKNFTYEYYGDGMVKAVNYPQLAGGTSLRTEYTYDNINRLTTMKNIMGGQIITQYDYGYDNNGNITSVTENGQTTNYTYDALNRLTGIQRPGGEQLIYQYDARGNRSLASANDKGLDGFIPGSLSYNNWEQVAAFTTGGQTYNYSYNPEGLRNKKVTPTGTTRYHYDNNGRVVAEANASGAVTAQMIWGKQALARKVSGVYYYYLYNGHGDVTQVIDQNGNIVDSYTCDEWGNILSKQEQLPQPLKYAGEYYDDESGLYYLRARYYDPTVGRFISEDPYEGEITNPLSLNLYAYCYSNPIIYKDPTGNWVESDNNFSTTVQVELLKLTLAWCMATSDEDRNDIHNAAKDIRETVSSGFGKFLDKSKSISGAAADEFSWFLGGDVSKAERDYWLTQVQNYDSSISIDEKTALNASMFVIGILSPSPDDAVKMISKKALKQMSKEVDEAVAQKFFKSMTKYAEKQGANGIKKLSGNGIKGCMYEVKVKGAGGTYRLLGNKIESGGIYWEYFEKIH